MRLKGSGKGGTGSAGKDMARNIGRHDCARKDTGRKGRGMVTPCSTGLTCQFSRSFLGCKNCDMVMLRGKVGPCQISIYGIWASLAFLWSF